MKRFGEYNEADTTNWFKRQTPVGLLLKIIGGILCLSLLFGVIGFAADWFNTGAKVVSPENVKKQWQFAYDYDASLTAISQQWCTAKSAENAETNSDYKSQRITQRIAVENNYARVAAEYNGRLKDAFRAKLVKPSDVPDQAPPLAEQTGVICPNP